MEYVIIIARSVTQAQRMMRTLEDRGIWAKIFRAPVGLTEFGCSYAVKIRREKLWQAMDCLRRSGLKPLSVHEKTESGYREVQT